ncbi:MAG: hypothetical protein ACLT9P_06640 [Evtepia gabavorous]
MMFAPVISTIPFVGYLFRLEEQTSGQDFVQTLRDAADPGGISAPRPMRQWSAGEGTSSSS